MLVIGLTGGIGTGKSEVARLLQSLGAAVISADEVGHEAYAPNSESWREVVDTFGKEILQPSGEIDRQKLGAIVFSDPQQLEKLNAIMHPRMARMVADRIQVLRDQGASTVVVEAALLFEAGWDSTDSSVESVVERLQARNGMDEKEARRRIDSQMDPAERIERSDLVVDNSSDVSALEQTVMALWENRVSVRTERG